MALGATIDFEAGNIKRAPLIFQKLALEWFYRFLKEPQRLFKRYFIDDMQFFYYFGKQLLGIYKDPFSQKQPLSSKYSENQNYKNRNKRNYMR